MQSKGGRKIPYRLLTIFGSALLGAATLCAPTQVTAETAPSSTATANTDTRCKHDKRFSSFQTLPASWQGIIERSDGVKGFAGLKGEQLYEALPAKLRAGMLNIFTKADATPMADGSSVLDHLQAMTEIRQDRIFTVADAELAPDMDTATAQGEFYHRSAIDGSLHHARPPFTKYASYKTHDNRGNLDMTLSSHARDWAAEIDIDYYKKGLRHFFLEVVHNHALHARTNPYKVEKILEKKQGLEPPYHG